MSRVCEFGDFSQREKFSWHRCLYWLPPDCSIARLLAIGFISLKMAMVAYPVSAQPPAPNRSMARSYFSSARRALAAGDSATALEKIRLAVELDPHFAEAYFLLGLLEFQGGETAESIQHYKHALNLQPRSYSGHYNLALAYLKEHRLPEARAQLEHAVNLDARQADAAYDLGIVLLELGEPSAALTHLRHARALKPRPDVDFNIVRAEIEAGRVSEARADAEAAAKVLGADFQWNAAIG